jgi:hypothetical protein
MWPGSTPAPIEPVPASDPGPAGPGHPIPAATRPTGGRAAYREGFLGIGVGGCWTGAVIPHGNSNQASGFHEGFGGA